MQCRCVVAARRGRTSNQLTEQSIQDCMRRHRKCILLRMSRSADGWTLDGWTDGRTEMNGWTEKMPLADNLLRLVVAVAAASVASASATATAEASAAAAATRMMQMHNV